MRPFIDAEGETAARGPGGRAGGRPVLWVRVGAGAAALGYALTFVLHAVGGVAEAVQALELATAMVATLALGLAGRRPGLAATLLVAMVSLELLVATLIVEGSETVTSIVLPVLVLTCGLLLGARSALAAAASAAVLHPIALAASGRHGFLLERLPPFDVARVVVVEVAVLAAGVLTWLAASTLGRAHAEAEARRQLEARLRHLQRLQVVGQLSGAAAHDFRNLLGIFQNTASLLSAMEDPATRALGKDLLQTARSGAAITGRLLSLARFEPRSRAVIDVAQTVEALRPLVARLLGPRCSLELRAEGPALAVAHPEEVEQVVLNLAANARDAMEAGGPVRVCVRRLEREEAERLGSAVDSPRQLVVEVQDSGKGIDPALHDRIFEPFVTTKARGEGTGLGLATVKAIATSSGGAVSLESAPGNGASFRVFLPEVVAAPG